jgi:H/ACA ribonucleoprotein complex subunit 1
VLHTCEGDLVCKNTVPDIPYFNAPIFMENKTQLGKIEEIFGSLTDAVSSAITSHRFDVRRSCTAPQHFTVKLGEGFPASSFKVGDKVYVDPYKMLPLDRFKPQPKVRRLVMCSLVRGCDVRAHAGMRRCR